MDMKQMRVGLELVPIEGPNERDSVIYVRRVDKQRDTVIIDLVDWKGVLISSGMEYAPETLARVGWKIKPGQMIVGSIVRIREGTRFYEQGGIANPPDVLGEIVSYDNGGDLCITVLWANDSHNVYNEEDLILHSAYKEPKKTVEKKAVMPKMADVVKEVANGNEGTARYAVIFANGKWGISENTACHNGLSSFYMQRMTKKHDSRKPRWVVSSVARGLRTREGRAFIKWLVDESTWAPAFRYRSAWVLKNKCVVCYTDVASNFLAGALIATRITWEHPAVASVWYKLYKSGVNGNLSLMAAPILEECDSKKGYRLRSNNRGHYPLNVSVDKDYISNFVKGQMILREEPWNNTLSYKNVNDAWGVSGASYLEHELTKVAETLEVRVWGMVERVRVVTIPKVVECLKALEKKL